MFLNSSRYSFPQKVWITGGILAFIIIMILLLKTTFSVLLLILAGVLIAVFFRGLSGWIERKTKWKAKLCLTISIVGSILVFILISWLIGNKVQAQVNDLAETLPSSIENARNRLNATITGKKIVEEVSSAETQTQMKTVAQSFFKSTFGILGDVYVVLFLGIFFTVSPQTYKNGIVQLVPKQGKKKADEVLLKIGSNLKKWLKGQLFAMLVVTILSAIGLLIIGVPMWLALAIIAGFLNFIPNFGPLIAMIPAVLVAYMQSPTTAIFVAALYIVIQILESNFITPMVQQKLINIPPALIIIAQLLISPLTGGWGLVLAMPLMVIIIVLVQELYIKKQEV